MTFPAIVPGPDEEFVLNARTEKEFVELLRLILTRSGRTAGKVASYANLPRSTAYHFVSPKNTRIPKDRDQVEAFAQACKLNVIQVQRLLWLWDTLNAASDAEVIDAELVEDNAIANITGVPDRLGISPGVSAGTSQNNVVIHGSIHVVNNGTGQQQAGQRDEPRDDQDDYGTGRRRGRRSKGELLMAVLDDSTKFRNAMLLLILIGIFLMAATFVILAVVAPGSTSAVLPVLMFLAAAVLAVLQVLGWKRRQ